MHPALAGRLFHGHNGIAASSCDKKWAAGLSPSFKLISQFRSILRNIRMESSYPLSAQEGAATPAIRLSFAHKPAYCC